MTSASNKQHGKGEPGAQAQIQRIDKQGKTPLDYVSNIVDAFKRIKKGSTYYQRILVQK